MSGAGSLPAGSSPAGVTVFDYGAQANGAIYLDNEGNAQGSALLDPATKQHVYTSSGFVVGQNNSAQRVLLALTTELGSSVLGANFGLAPLTGLVTPDLPKRRTAAIENALDHLIQDGSIELLSVEVDVSKKPILTIVRWRDLSSDSEQTVAI